MPIRRIILQLFLLITVASMRLIAQPVAYSNEFLAIGVDARSLGMSNATVASVNDGNSGYWNPAGLLQLKSNLEVNLMHSDYFAGIAQYDYGSIAARIDSSSAASFSVIRFGVDNIPNTTLLIDANGNVNYNNITSFSEADYAFLFSYARQLKIPGLRLGGNVKVIRRVIGDFASAWGFGLDLGAQYDYKKWKFGAMLRDATSTFNAWNFNLSDNIQTVFQQTGNQIPTNSVEVTMPTLILGIARKFEIKKDFSLLAEIDLTNTFDGERNVLIGSSIVSLNPAIGIEAGYKDFIFLRAGVGGFQTMTDITGNTIHTVEPSFGVGVRFKAVMLEYALANIGDALYSNVFSLKLDINKHIH
jgi:hypothetical protein